MDQDQRDTISYTIESLFDVANLKKLGIANWDEIVERNANRLQEMLDDEMKETPRC